MSQTGESESEKFQLRYKKVQTLTEESKMSYETSNGNVLGETTGVYLIILQGPGIKGPAQEKFGYHTAQGPHIYGFTKW